MKVKDLSSMERQTWNDAMHALQLCSNLLCCGYSPFAEPEHQRKVQELTARYVRSLLRIK